MTIKLVFGILFFIIGMTGVGLGNFALHSMVECINRTRPANAQISQFAWWAEKIFRVIDEYKRLDSSSRFYWYFQVAIALLLAGFVGLVASAIARLG